MAAVIEFRLTGGSSNTDPNASLGGVMSSTQMPQNIFDDIQPEEAANGDTEYRAIDVYNSGDATAGGVVIYMSQETTSPNTRIDLGYDSANSPHDPSASLPTIPDESTAPSGITFDHYTASNKLSLPDIPAGQAVRVWLKRVVDQDATNLNPDTGKLRVDYA